jgi:sugar phosphate isomerase/epimerase
MKIGMITDSLPGLDFDALVETAARLELDMLEFGCGNWSSAPHLNLDRMLESDGERRNFTARLADHGIAISALNCSGNPLHPGELGRRHDDVTRKTIKLASLMGVERVVMMSGCPGAEGDHHPNWITVEWPPETREILRWQWDEVLIPYWRDLVAYATNTGIRKLCLELHGHQNVYNVRTLLKLREAVGDTVGANFDPSHLMWMGADPIAAVRSIDGVVYHVHAKDTRVDPVIAAVNGLLETTPGDRFQKRAWNYITLGYGHGEQWWRELVAVLAAAGYDDVFSIEHEDPMLPALEGVEKSVAFLRNVLINRPRSGRSAR